jgi:1,4-dihydroxy-2-naphthoate octaprenyltransferase
MSADSTKESLRERAITFTSNPLVSIALSVLFTIVLRLLIKKAWPDVTDWWVRPIGTLYVLLAGVGLYRFRKYFQKHYGLAELGVAVLFSWISIGRAQILQDAGSKIAVVVAAYFIVRGLTNYYEGKEKAVAENDF